MIIQHKFTKNSRADGRIEAVCEHGVAHTIYAPEIYKIRNRKYWAQHGCDGCCNKSNLTTAIKRELLKK